MQSMQNMMNQVGNPQQMVGPMSNNPNQMQNQQTNPQQQQHWIKNQIMMRQQAAQQQMHMGVS